MNYDITIDNRKVNYFPGNEIEEIMQNVITICTTLKGSVPMDRDFGVSRTVIDVPENTARALLSAEYISAVRKFEPRAQVASVRFVQSDAGQIRPVVSVRLSEG